MMTTELLPNGEVLITEFPDRSITPLARYYWTAADGWRMWINSENVDGGGYWRAFTNESQLAVLNIQMQNAIAALAARAGNAE